MFSIPVHNFSAYILTSLKFKTVTLKKDALDDFFKKVDSKLVPLIDITQNNICTILPNNNTKKINSC